MQASAARSIDYGPYSVNEAVADAVFGGS